MDVDILQRFWSDLVSRPGGPMSFRFFLQPLMALIFAVRDGIRDGRTGNSPYFWTIARGNREQRRRSLREGAEATGRIFIIGILMDLIYQWRMFRTIYPVEAVVIAIVLAYLPYLALRGPVARITRWWINRH